MLKRRGFKAPVASQIQTLETRVLATITVNPADVTRSVSNVDGDYFQPPRQAGYVPLNFSLEASAQGQAKKEVTKLDYANEANYFHNGDALSAEVLVKVEGSVRGVINQMSAYAVAGVWVASVHTTDTQAENNEQMAVAVISVSGWGNLSLRIQGQALTTRFFDYTATSETHSYVEGEAEVQSATGDYVITAKGNFSFQFSVEVSRQRLNFNTYNLADGQDSAKTISTEAHTAVRINAPLFTLKGESVTDTSHQYILQDSDTDPAFQYTQDSDVTYASHGEAKLDLKGSGVVSSHVYATSDNLLSGFVEKLNGWGFDHRYEARASLLRSSIVHGQDVFVGLEANYLDKGRRSNVFWTLGLDSRVKTANITAGNTQAGPDLKILDRLWQDVQQLSWIL